MSNREELSQAVFGLIQAGKISSSLVKPAWFLPPYDTGVEVLQQGGEREDIAKVVSVAYMNDAHEAVKSLNGLGDEIDWAISLKDAYESDNLGLRFQKVGKKLRENQKVDLLELHADMGSLLAGKSNGSTLLKDLDYNNFSAMIPSGWDVLDNIVGGIPQHGLIVVVAETGTGKSFFLAKLTTDFLLKYPDKKGMIFTLEMPGEEYAKRSVDMYPNMRKASDRLYINGSLRTIDEIVLEVSTHKVDWVGIDFVDWLVSENSESAYSHVYKRCVEMARILRIPVVLLGQPNRENVKAAPGEKRQKFLSKFSLRYTGMAENSAWLLLALQIGNKYDLEEDKYPLYEEDHEYIGVLKLRGEWRKQRGPGVIILEPSTQKWGGKAIGNKLHTLHRSRPIGGGQ